MICAVIVSYNSDKVFRCYESVKNQVDHIVIVDNATSDASIIDRLKVLNKDSTKVVFNKENLGIAAALNQGVEYARERNCDWLLTLDHDSELPPATAADMISAYNTLPEDVKAKAAVLGCKYLERQFGEWRAESGVNGKWQQTFKENNLMVTSGNFVKVSSLIKTGTFTKKLFIDYVDIEFYYRVLKAGFVNLEAQNVFIIHEFGQSQKKFGFHITNQPPLRRYYISRNSIYFFKEFLSFRPYRAFRVMFGGTIGGALKILLFERDKLTKFRYIAEGILDALRNRYGKKDAGRQGCGDAE